MSNDKVNFNAIMPMSTLVYVGRRKLRNDEEPNIAKAEDILEYDARMYPHTFINFSGVRLMTVLEHAGGQQGSVVDAQKVIRDKATLNEVNAFRDSFENEDQAIFVGENAVNVPDKVLDGIANGEPFVVLDFNMSTLDVPMQPDDMLNIIRERASVLYEGMFAELDVDAQREKVVALWPEITNMLN